MRQTTAIALGFLLLSAWAAAEDSPSGLKYGDGQPDGKQSLGGSGELIQFTLPAGTKQVAGLKIHGSRYGTATPPDESFLIYFLNPELTRIIHTEMAPYSLFEQGPEKWVTITFEKPAELPQQVWVAVDFRATQRKGVYVSYDTSTGGKFSRAGLPGTQATPTKFGGDWMMELVPAE
jgi:hypothetical protein